MLEQANTGARCAEARVMVTLAAAAEEASP